MQHGAKGVQQEPATPVQHSELKRLAGKVLGRNIATRPLCNSRAEDVSHSGEKRELVLQHQELACAETADCERAISPLSRSNGGRGLVLTLEDLPELERRLRVSGWHVERRGNELVCTSRKVRVQ